MSLHRKLRGRHGMKIVIVDDDREFAQKTEAVVQAFFGKVQEPIEIQTVTGGKRLLEELQEKKEFDIYLLDIEMPDMDGLELARRIREFHREAKIVFVTSYDQYAVSSYKVRASYYVLKRDYERDLYEALDMIWTEEKRRREYLKTDFYTIQNEYREKRFALDDILYLKKDGKYVVFSCIGEKEYRERTTLEAVLEKLPQDRFIRIDKGCIVNMRYVFERNENAVTVYAGGSYVQLPVSRRLIPKVSSQLLEYWRKV